MSETRVAWKVWARRLRGRWTRRTVVSGSSFVWLRLHRPQAAARLHLTIRLSPAIRLSVNVSLAPRTPAPGQTGVPSVSVRHHPLTLVAHAGSWRPVTVARPAAGSIRRGHPTTGDPDRGAYIATRWLRRAVTLGDWQPRRGAVPQGTLVASRQQRDADLSSAANPLGSHRLARLRHEPPIVAPPPMTPRRPRHDAPSQPIPPPAADAKLGPPSAQDPGMPRWAAAAPPHTATMSGPALSALTEHVMRQINDRVRARRERLGKV
jgi:hypothetical protein